MIKNFIHQYLRIWFLIDPMMPPPVIAPTIPPIRDRNEDHRNNQNDYREHDDKRAASSSSAWRTRDKERDYRERERGKTYKSTWYTV